MPCAEAAACGGFFLGGGGVFGGINGEGEGN